MALTPHAVPNSILFNISLSLAGDNFEGSSVDYQHPVVRARVRIQEMCSTGGGRRRERMPEGGGLATLERQATDHRAGCHSISDPKEAERTVLYPGQYPRAEP